MSTGRPLAAADRYRLPLTVVTVGLLSIAVLIGTDQLRQRSVVRDNARVKAMGEIQRDVAISHLWLEEHVTRRPVSTSTRSKGVSITRWPPSASCWERRNRASEVTEPEGSSRSRACGRPGDGARSARSRSSAASPSCGAGASRAPWRWASARPWTSSTTPSSPASWPGLRRSKPCSRAAGSATASRSRLLFMGILVPAGEP